MHATCGREVATQNGGVSCWRGGDGALDHEALGELVRVGAVKVVKRDEDGARGAHRPAHGTLSGNSEGALGGRWRVFGNRRAPFWEPLGPDTLEGIN